MENNNSDQLPDKKNEWKNNFNKVTVVIYFLLIIPTLMGISKLFLDTPSFLVGIFAELFFRSILFSVLTVIFAYLATRWKIFRWLIVTGTILSLAFFFVGFFYFLHDTISISYKFSYPVDIFDLILMPIVLYVPFVAFQSCRLILSFIDKHVRKFNPFFVIFFSLLAILSFLVAIGFIGLPDNHSNKDYPMDDHFIENPSGTITDFVPFEKPIVYLYPQKDELVSVRLEFDGDIFTSYPEYDKSIGGWKVLAHPDGSLIDVSDGNEYDYLFWEGKPRNHIDWNMETGFVVSSNDTHDFLLSKLLLMGMSSEECQDFIDYWVPRMQKNEYNLVHFAREEYTDKARLSITPEPDSLLRVFMVFKGIDNPITIKEQEIIPFQRKGFSVIEWGGTEIR